MCWLAYALGFGAIMVSSAAAQVPTAGASLYVAPQRMGERDETESQWTVDPWLAFSIGRGVSTRICAGCESRAANISPERAWGLTGALTAGLTLVPRLGVGVTLAGFSYCESYDCISGRGGIFYLATVKYAPEHMGGVALRASAGEAQSYEQGFGGGKAPGPVIGLGATAHLPPHSPLSLTVSLDDLESLAGKYRAAPRYNPRVGAYRTRVFSIGVGVELWFAHAE
jgi:hypothetical protein